MYMISLCESLNTGKIIQKKLAKLMHIVFVHVSKFAKPRGIRNDMV